MEKYLNVDTKYEKTLYKFSITLLVLQLGFIIWANLTQLDKHIGFDASAYYLQVMEMVKQRTIVPNNWEFQTTLLWDSPALLATFVYKLTGNIFNAYGISNLICGGVLISIIINICKELKIKKISILILLNIILTPFLTPSFNNANDIKYFSVMFVSIGAYSIKISTILMYVLVNIRLFTKKINTNMIICSFLSLLLIFISSISSGLYMLAFIIIPIFSYFILTQVLGHSEKIYKYNIMFILTSIVIAILGKWMSSQVLGFNSGETGFTIIGLKNFWNNMGSIFLGYFDLLNALPLESNVTIFSKIGLGFVLNLSIAMFLFALVINYIIKMVRYYYIINPENLIMFCMFFNLIMFIFINTTYGAPIFESRYLIPVYFFMTFLAIYNLEMSINKYRIYKFINGFLIMLLFMANLCSFFKYSTEKIQKIEYEEFISLADKYNTNVVYILDSKDPIFARNLRVLDNTKVYKYTTDLKLPYHWGDYTYYDEISTVNKGSLLFSNIDDFSNLPIYIQNKFEKVKENKRYDIYYATNSPIDFVSGITDNDKNIDMMYTVGVNLAEGIFDEDGNYLIDNKDGYVVWGPYKKAVKGTYDFTLNYEIMESDDNIGYFEVSTNNGTNIIAKDLLEKSKTEIKLKNVEFYDEESLFEYRLYLNKGVKIKLKNIEIIRTK